MVTNLAQKLEPKGTEVTDKEKMLHLLIGIQKMDTGTHKIVVDEFNLGKMSAKDILCFHEYLKVFGVL